MPSQDTMNPSSDRSGTFWMRLQRDCHHSGKRFSQFLDWVKPFIHLIYLPGSFLWIDICINCVKWHLEKNHWCWVTHWQLRLHHRASIFTFSNTIFGSPWTAARWKKPCDQGCGGMRNSGLQTWTTAVSSLGSWRSACLTPTWPSQCLMPWRAVSWVGFLVISTVHCLSLH